MGHYRAPDENRGARTPGGEGGNRTPGTVTRTPHFECGAFNHSATSPWRRARECQPALCKQGALTKQEHSQDVAIRKPAMFWLSGPRLRLTTTAPLEYS